MSPPILFESQRTDLETIWRRSAEVAWRLSSLGATENARVVLALEHSLTALELLFACFRLQVQCVFVPPTSSSALWEGLIEHLRPSFAACDANNRRFTLPGEPTRFHDGRGESGRVLAWRLEANGPSNHNDFPRRPVGDSPLCWDNLLNNQPPALFYTSGSTSKAKAVILEWPRIAEKAEAVLNHYGTTSADCVAPILPFTHVYGLYPLIGGWRLSCAAAIVRESASPGVIARTLAASAASVVICPPAVGGFIFGRRHIAPELQSCVRVLSMGGAAAQAEIVQRIRENLPQTRMFLSYGLVETYSTICCQDITKDPALQASVGQAPFNCWVEIRDAQSGDPVEGGNAGELCVGGVLSPGYLCEGKRTPLALTSDGLFRTGDLALLDDRQRVWLKGRIKHVINAGGLTIYPSEIEEVLRRDKRLSDVAVFGEVALGREYPVAAVVMKEQYWGQKEQVITELYETCRAALAEKLIPRTILPLESIPRNALGKVVLPELRAQATQGRSPTGVQADV